MAVVSDIDEAARRGLDMQRITSEPLVVASPSDHRHAGARAIDFREFREESFILFPEDATIRSTFDRLATRFGLSPNVAFVTSDEARMRELVSLGLGITVLPLSDATRPGADHAIAFVSNQPLTYDVYLAFRASRLQSLAVRAMVSLITASLPQGTESLCGLGLRPVAQGSWLVLKRRVWALPTGNAQYRILTGVSPLLPNATRQVPTLNVRAPGSCQHAPKRGRPRS